MLPRHAFKVSFAALAASVLPLWWNAAAQLPPSTYDELQKTLEQKFNPRKSKPKPAPSSGKDDFIYIEPKDGEQNKTNTAPFGKALKSSASASFAGQLYAFFPRSSEPDRLLLTAQRKRA